MTQPDTERRLGRVEFTALLAMSMALAALGTDIVLPAFGEMRADMGLPSDSTAVTGVISAYFFGLAVSQVFYGPLADRFGRKPILYVGYAIYLIGAVASALAPTLELVVAARFVWGLGAAGPRVVTLTVVRDRYGGEEMSRAMSFIMAVFVLVPIVSPSLGAAVAVALSWRWVFGVCAVLVTVMAVWATRLEESLATENRRELSLVRIRESGRMVFTNRLTMGYTVALTFLFGAFLSYLASSELIFAQVFGAGESFPLYFGGLAAVMGAAMLVNAALVRRLGIRRLVQSVMLVYVFGSLAFLTVAFLTGGRPPLWVFLLGMMVLLSSHALLIPNFNSIAMEPMRRVAGTASAVIGTVSTAGGALLGALLDRTFDGTVLPFFGGYLVFGVLALGTTVWAENGRLRRPATGVPD